MPSYFTQTPAQTKKLGGKIARRLKGGEVLALIGGLGSGKTTFIKGLARGLGVKDTITSPTFVLMKIYQIKPVKRFKRGRIRKFVHVDCYRVPGVELANVGLADYLNQPDTVVAIEWAEKIKLPRGSKKIYFKHGQSANQRTIKIINNS